MLTLQRKLKVFIVEDELLNIELYHSLLATLSDRFQICAFRDGDSAWEELSKADPDILITDMLHPGLDGWELLELLAAEKVSYPILVISGDHQGVDFLKSCHPNLSLHFLGKPFQLSALHRHLVSLLERGDATMVPPMNRQEFSPAAAHQLT